MPNVVSYPYRLDKSISNFRVAGCFCFFIFIQIEKKLLYAISGESDQTPRSVAPDLGLYRLHMPYKKDVRLKLPTCI